MWGHRSSSHGHCSWLWGHRLARWGIGLIRRYELHHAAMWGYRFVMWGRHSISCGHRSLRHFSVLLSVFALYCNIIMSLSILMCFFTVFEDAPLYNMFVNMFPLSGVPVGPESFCTGGCKVNWGNKSCKYVYKYFFVFLSIQFLSIVFFYALQSHCKP